MFIKRFLLAGSDSGENKPVARFEHEKMPVVELAEENVIKCQMGRTVCAAGVNKWELEMKALIMTAILSTETGKTALCGWKCMFFVSWGMGWDVECSKEIFHIL